MKWALRVIDKTIEVLLREDPQDFDGVLVVIEELKQARLDIVAAEDKRQQATVDAIVADMEIP